MKNKDLKQSNITILDSLIFGKPEVDSPSTEKKRDVVWKNVFAWCDKFGTDRRFIYARSDVYCRDA